MIIHNIIMKNEMRILWEMGAVGHEEFGRGCIWWENYAIQELCIYDAMYPVQSK